MIRLIPCLLLLLAAPSYAQSTNEVFAATRDALVQVRIIDIASGAKGAIGSGFVAHPDGRIVSNYHVISELLQHPGRYQAEWLAPDGSAGPLELLDIDIAHDLAVLRAPGRKPPTALALQTKLPKKGQRVYSIGNPYDLGPTIVEGTFNGLIEKSLYRRVHLTASINPGMSGGPAVLPDGSVVGVNVASAGEQIGFLVESEWVALLIARNAKQPLKKFKAEINRQLDANQRGIFTRLKRYGFKSAELGTYQVPAAMGDEISCWSFTDQAKKRVVDSTTLNCQAEGDVFVSSALSTGSLRYSHSLRRARNISNLRFWALNARAIGFEWAFLSGGEDEVSNFVCRTDLVEHAKLKRKVRLCVRRYKNYPAIHDVVLRQISLNDSTRALASTLVMTGVGYQEGTRFAREFMEQTR